MSESPGLFDDVDRAPAVRWRRTTIAALVLVSLTFPTFAREFHVTTGAGRPVRVAVQASWHHDCSPDTPPQISVLQQPSSGSVSVQPSSTTIFNPDAGGEQCVGRPARGVGIFYRPQGGFRGTDRFSFQASYPNGVVLSHNADVTVR